ncbi:MAG: hypothetical protein IPJ19_08710 [Planctomycetes bacterium]|nr:hypothetical protein [Planctomycetota bacterium]
MGRIATFLLVLIIAALAARVLFVDDPNPDELGPPAAQPTLKPQVPLQPAIETLPASDLPPPELATQSAPLEPALPKVTIIDPDPDLDDNTEPADCQGTPEPH